MLTGPTGLTYHRTSPLLPVDHHIVNPEQVDCRLCRSLEGLSPGPVQLKDHLTERIDNLPGVDVEAVMLLPFAGAFFRSTRLSTGLNPRFSAGETGMTSNDVVSGSMASWILPPAFPAGSWIMIRSSVSTDPPQTRSLDSSTGSITTRVQNTTAPSGSSSRNSLEPLRRMVTAFWFHRQILTRFPCHPGLTRTSSCRHPFSRD